MLSGPYCSMLLADQGAEVIKVESRQGDTTRINGPFLSQDPQELFGGYFSSVNRNKKSIVLDLKSPEGVEAVLRLVDTSHVVVENFRSGVMDRLGLGYERLRDRNPAIVYATIRGFGDGRSGKSPYDSWPAYDVVAQAMGGLMGITGPDADTPIKVGPGVGDIFPGTMAAFGILAALLNARSSGRGQFVDVAMYDAILALCERIVYQHSYAGAVPRPEGNSHPLFAPFGLFRAADGWVALAVPSDSFWQILTSIMGVAELASDERFARKLTRGRNKVQVNEIVGAWVAKRTKAELAELLGGKVPFGPVNTIEDIFSDPHVEARGMLAKIELPEIEAPAVVVDTPIKLSSTPGGVNRRPPFLGEHTYEILSDIGFSDDEIGRARGEAEAETQRVGK
jgi:crotonobetainyl-CoA:carnitine CoA-transferase CaiB-like acyl-CoA transferase